MKKVDHPNIIKIYESYEDEANYYLVTEYFGFYSVCVKEGNFSIGLLIKGGFRKLMQGKYSRKCSMLLGIAMGRKLLIAISSHRTFCFWTITRTLSNWSISGFLMNGKKIWGQKSKLVVRRNWWELHIILLQKFLKEITVKNVISGHLESFSIFWSQLSHLLMDKMTRRFWNQSKEENTLSTFLRWRKLANNLKI